MSVTAHIAKHFRAVHAGGNWTDVNLKTVLADVNWQEATTKTGSFNTIAALVFHMNYFVSAVLKVLQGGSLDAHDKFSFDCPPIQSEEDWEKLVTRVLDDADKFAALVEQLPEPKLWEDFTDKKYGSYYTNLHGIIEHTHYHLGQVVLLKKMIRSQTR
jgi:uncharacterized damage-inducible protein DinB